MLDTYKNKGEAAWTSSTIWVQLQSRYIVMNLVLDVMAVTPSNGILDGSAAWQSLLASAWPQARQ
jgi:hypothetical protein